MPNICYSGGAQGADTIFGEEALKAGHEVIHYGFAEMSRKHNPNVILNDEELKQGHWYLVEANTWLKRTYPTKSPYVDRLLQRNFYQIKDTQRVYAVSYIIQRGMVAGGTSWAVTMAILNGVPEIYVYDQEKHSWFKFDKKNIDDLTMNWYTWIPPRPFGHYTGIGSTDITPQGEQAIRKLYS